MTHHRGTTSQKIFGLLRGQDHVLIATTLDAYPGTLFRSLVAQLSRQRQVIVWACELLTVIE